MFADCVTSELLNQGMIMPKDAFYFKHDTNASSDLKLKAIRKHYGWQGYGWFWFLIELFRSEEEYKLEYCQLTFDGLAGDMDCPPDKVKEYLDYCIRIKLLEQNGNYFYSPRLLRDMEVVDTTRELRRDAGIRSAQKRLGVSISSTSVKHKLNNSSTIREDNKEKIIKIIIPDFIDEELWNDFLDMRKKARRPATLKAQELLIKDLEKLKSAGDDPNEVIKQSIKNGWQGLFPLKRGQNGTHKSDSRQVPKERHYTRPEDL